MQQDDEFDHRPRGRGPLFRWTARLVFVVLGLMMGLVVASDPRVTSAARDALARAQSADDAVTRQDTSLALPIQSSDAVEVIRLDAMAPSDEDAQSDARPTVSVMPESRVNVIRLAP